MTTYLPIKVAAALLDTTEKTMFRQAASCKIPTFKWGCTWIYWPALQTSLPSTHPHRWTPDEEIGNAISRILERQAAMGDILC